MNFTVLVFSILLLAWIAWVCVDSWVIGSLLKAMHRVYCRQGCPHGNNKKGFTLWLREMFNA